MDVKMSEKFDELLLSVNELKQSRKTDAMLMRGFIVACGAVMIYFISFMIQTSSKLAKIESTLATTENITTLERKISALDIKFHNELGAFLTISSYIAIEAQRTITLADVLYDFGRDVNVKDEELERFRNTVIFKMNNNVKLGTVRDVK